jgi:hypothetical protein
MKYSGLCLTVGFGITGVELSDSASKEIVTYRKILKRYGTKLRI